MKLKDEAATKFNPPSLRGVSQNGPYFMMDGPKARSSFQEFGHQLDRELSGSDQ